MNKSSPKQIGQAETSLKFAQISVLDQAVYDSDIKFHQLLVEKPGSDEDNKVIRGKRRITDVLEMADKIEDLRSAIVDKMMDVDQELGFKHQVFCELVNVKEDLSQKDRNYVFSGTYSYMQDANTVRYVQIAEVLVKASEGVKEGMQRVEFNFYTNIFTETVRHTRASEKEDGPDHSYHYLRMDIRKTRLGCTLQEIEEVARSSLQVFLLTSLLSILIRNTLQQHASSPQSTETSSQKHSDGPSYSENAGLPPHKQQVDQEPLHREDHSPSADLANLPTLQESFVPAIQCSEQPPTKREYLYMSSPMPTKSSEDTLPMTQLQMSEATGSLPDYSAIAEDSYTIPESEEGSDDASSKLIVCASQLRRTEIESPKLCSLPEPVQIQDKVSEVLHDTTTVEAPSTVSSTDVSNNGQESNNQHDKSCNEPSLQPQSPSENDLQSNLQVVDTDTTTYKPEKTNRAKKTPQSLTSDYNLAHECTVTHRDLATLSKDQVSIAKAGAIPHPVKLPELECDDVQLFSTACLAYNSPDSQLAIFKASDLTLQVSLLGLPVSYTHMESTLQAIRKGNLRDLLYVLFQGVVPPLMACWTTNCKDVLVCLKVSEVEDTHPSSTSMESEALRVTENDSCSTHTSIKHVRSSIASEPSTGRKLKISESPSESCGLKLSPGTFQIPSKNQSSASNLEHAKLSHHLSCDVQFSQTCKNGQSTLLVGMLLEYIASTELVPHRGKPRLQILGVGANAKPAHSFSQTAPAIDHKCKHLNRKSYSEAAAQCVDLPISLEVNLQDQTCMQPKRVISLQILVCSNGVSKVDEFTDTPPAAVSSVRLCSNGCQTLQASGNNNSSACASKRQMGYSTIAYFSIFPSNLATISENQVSITKARAIPHLLESECDDVQLFSAACLAYNGPDSQLAIFKASGLTLQVSLLGLPVSHTYMESTLQAIQKGNLQDLLYVLFQGVVPPLMACWTTHCKDVLVYSKLTEMEDMEDQVSIAKAGAIPHLVKLLESECDDVQLFSAACLGILVYDNPNNKSAIFKASVGDTACNPSSKEGHPEQPSPVQRKASAEDHPNGHIIQASKGKKVSASSNSSSTSDSDSSSSSEGAGSGDSSHEEGGGGCGASGRGDDDDDEDKKLPERGPNSSDKKEHSNKKKKKKKVNNKPEELLLPNSPNQEQTSQASASSNPDYHCQNTKGAVRKPVQAKKKFHLSLSRKQENSPSKLQQVPDMPIPASVTCLAPPISTVQGSPQMKLSEESNPSGVGRSSIVGLRSSLSSPNANQKSLIPTEEENRMQAIPGTGIGTVGSCSGSTQPPVQPPEGTSKVPSPVVQCTPGRHQGLPELTENTPIHAEGTAQVPPSPVDRKAPGRQAGVMPELTEDVPTHAEAVPPSPVDRKAPGRQAGVMPELTEDVPTHAEAVPPSPVDRKAPGRQAGVMSELTEDVPTHAEAVPPSPVDRKAPGRQAGVMPELTEDVPTHAEAVSPSPVDRKAPGRQAGVMPELTENVPTHAEAVPPSPVDRKAPGRQAGVMPELTEDVPTHAEAVSPSPVDRKAPGRQAGVMPEDVPTHAEAVPPSPVDRKAPGRQAGVMPELTEDVPTHAEAVPPSPVDRKAPGRQAGVMPELTEDVPTHAEAVPSSPVDRKAPGRQAGVMPELTEDVPTHAEAVPPSPVDRKAPGRQAGVMPELTENVPTHAEAIPPSPVDRKAPGRQAGVMPELTEDVPTHAEAVSPSPVDRKAPGRQAGVMPEDVPTHAEAVPPSPVDQKAPGRQAGVMPELTEDVPTHAEAVPPSPVDRKAPGRQAGVMPELTENVPTHAEAVPPSPVDRKAPGRQAGVMPELTEDVPTHAEAVPPSPVDRKAPGRQAGVMPELTEDVPTHAEAVPPSPVDRKAPGRQAGVMPELTENVPTHAEAVMPELTEDVPTHAEAVPPSPVDRKAPGRQAGVMPELTENVPTHAKAVPPSPVDRKAPGRQAGVMPELTEDVPTHAEAVPPSPVDRKAPGRQAGAMPELTEDVPTHAEAVPPSPVGRKAPGRQAGAMPELTENIPTHAEGTAQTPLSPLDQQVSGSEDYEHSSEVHYDDELNSVQEESYGVEPHEVLLGSGGNDSVLDFAVSHAHEPQSNTGSETLPEYDIAENTLSGYSYSEELQGVLQETPDEAHTGIESEHEPHPPTAFNIQHSPGLPPVIEPFTSSCGNCYTNNDDTAHFQIPQQEGNHTACPSPPGPSSQQVLHCHQTDGHHDATPPSNQSANTCGHTAHNVMCVGGELFTSPEASSIDSQHFGPQPFPNLWEPHGNVPVPSPLCGEEEEEVCHDVINKPPTIIAERTH